MKIMLRISLLMLFYSSFTGANQETKPAEAPSDTEIKLAMAQARHAFELYRAAVAHGEQLLSKSAFQQDRMLLDHWEETSKAVGQDPQAFNSELGFDAMIDLDDAARNTALCADQASSEVLKDINNLHSQRSQLLLELHQSCLDTSIQLFSAGENVNVLYTKYLAWQRKTNAERAEAFARCADDLKKSRQGLP